MANERYSEFIEETPKSYVQGLFEESTTQKHRLGTVRQLIDGREYIYVKNGATNLVAGQLIQNPAVDAANVANLAVSAANAGTRVVSVTPITPVAGDNEANAFAEGYLHINTGPGNGMAYKIKSHGAFTANTAANITLYDKLRGANLTTASKATLSKPPGKNVIVHTSPPTATLVGVATFPVTANYYAWLQKKGPAPVEMALDSANVLIAGAEAYASAAVNGCVTGQIITANFIDAAATQLYPVGKVQYIAANDHWALIDLKL